MAGLRQSLATERKREVDREGGEGREIERERGIRPMSVCWMDKKSEIGIGSKVGIGFLWAELDFTFEAQVIETNETCQ